MTERACLALLVCLASCGGSQQTQPPSTTTRAGIADRGQPPGAQAADASPGAPWWQGDEPACTKGKLSRRSLTWGRIFWCAVPGHRVDVSLQNDLGRVARCVSESVSAFQEEPEPGKLGDFLARAHEAGLNPVLCAAVRRDSEPRTYHGRAIVLERQEQAGDHVASSEISVRYRFGCQDCLVAAETRVLVAR